MNRLVVATALMLATTAASASEFVLAVGSQEGATSIMVGLTGDRWGGYISARDDGEDDVIICNDGWISDSTNRSGTCSWHGGVYSWDGDSGSVGMGVMYTYPIGTHGTSIRGQAGLAAVRQGGAEVNYEYELEATAGAAVHQMLGEKFGLTAGYDTLLGANVGVVLKF